MPDRTVAEVQQMAHRLPCPVGLIGVDHGIAVAGVRVDHHHLHARRQRQIDRVEQVYLHDHDDPVDGQLAEAGERPEHAVLGRRRHREQGDRVPLLGGLRGDRLDRTAVAGGRQSKQNDADGMKCPSF
jgi:hypothetical protein